MSFEKVTVAVIAGVLLSLLASSEVAGAGQGERVEKLYGQFVHTSGHKVIAVCSTEMSPHDVFGISHAPLTSREDLDYALAAGTLTGEGGWASKTGAGTCSMPARSATQPFKEGGIATVDLEDLLGPR